MPLPKVVIVGRPNVGKSSLFNWIAGRKIAIVDDVPGVTRDRISSLVQVDTDSPEAGFVELIDTGGIGMVDRDDLTEHVDEQINLALSEADLILFVVDLRDGLMPLDEVVASKLRYIDKPVILVINKVDEPHMESLSHEFHKLGRGMPVQISVLQNRNKRGLLEAIGRKVKDLATQRPADETMKLAVVGRPNTGKSTFINTLARVERVIVSEVPGTTRDSVDVRFEMEGLTFLAIDTAGVRRKAKIRDDLDFYSMHRAERSIRRADVVLLFLDATQGVARIDKQLADYITKQYKPCVIVVNKWDLMLGQAPESGELLNKYAYNVQHAFRTMAFAPLAFITAKTGKNVQALLNLCQSMHKQARRRASTGALNKVIQQAVEAHPPPMRDNRTPKVYYATQVGTEPPTVVLFVNQPKLFDAPYQRFLINVMREHLPFRDIPIKLYLRARKQESLEQRQGRRHGEPGHARSTNPSDSGLNFAEQVNDLLSDLDD